MNRTKKKAQFAPIYTFNNCSLSKISFVFDEDIARIHGAEWKKKFDELIEGSTCPVIREEDRPKKYKGKSLLACYSWDYFRFANYIEDKAPTYFD